MPITSILEKPDEKRSYHLVLHDPSFDPKGTKPIPLTCLAGFEELTEHEPTIRLQIWRSFLRHFTEALSGDNLEEIIEALWPWHYAPLLETFKEFLWLDGRFFGAVFYLVPTSSEYDPKKDLKASGEGQLYHVDAAPRETTQIKTRPYDHLLPLISTHARVDTQGLFIFPNPFAQILSGEIDKTTFSRALKCLNDPAFMAELGRVKAKPNNEKAIISTERAVSGAEIEERAERPISGKKGKGGQFYFVDYACESLPSDKIGAARKYLLPDEIFKKGGPSMDVKTMMKAAEDYYNWKENTEKQKILFVRSDRWYTLPAFLTTFKNRAQFQKPRGRPKIQVYISSD
jgi:hypothetical protein